MEKVSDCCKAKIKEHGTWEDGIEIATCSSCLKKCNTVEFTEPIKSCENCLYARYVIDPGDEYSWCDKIEKRIERMRMKCSEWQPLPDKPSAVLGYPTENNAQFENANTVKPEAVKPEAEGDALDNILSQFMCPEDAADYKVMIRKALTGDIVDEFVERLKGEFIKRGGNDLWIDRILHGIEKIADEMRWNK